MGSEPEPDVDWTDPRIPDSCPTCGRELGSCGDVVVCDNCGYRLELPDPLAGLDFEVEEPTDVVDVTKLDDYELSNLDRDTRHELIVTGEMHTPMLECSERGRQLHTTFMACKIEMRKRHP